MTLGVKQEQWLSALESGEYQQCFNYFSCDGRHCVYGVAMNEFGVHGNIWHKLTGLLALRNWHQILNMNDVQKRSFVEIARIIRMNPENFFLEPR
jgi:hypothetical protein